MHYDVAVVKNFLKLSKLSHICWIFDKKKSANSSANFLLDLSIGSGFSFTDDVNSDTNLYSCFVSLLQA